MRGHSITRVLHLPHYRVSKILSATDREIHIELTPYKRIRYSDKFDDPNLPGEMIATIELKKVSCGTELTVVQEGLPAAIPVEMCYLGWQESLILLAKLVEPEIKG